jgi:hypothetical protein
VRTELEVGVYQVHTELDPNDRSHRRAGLAIALLLGYVYIASWTQTMQVAGGELWDRGGTIKSPEIVCFHLSSQRDCASEGGGGYVASRL